MTAQSKRPERTPPDTPGDSSPPTGQQVGFEGHHALITGAGLGIGRELATYFAGQGATVHAVDLDEAVLDLAAREPDGGTSRVRPSRVDLADPEGLAALGAEIESTDSEVDILVNCAATYPPGGLLESTAADWSRVLAVNVVAGAALARAMARRLIRQGAPGSIVNIGSIQAGLPLFGHAAYVASKGAVTSMTRALAVELGSFGIRVNEVDPGVIHTDAYGTRMSDDRPATALGRAGTPQDVAEAVGYLASDRAGYVTGAVLTVDGGRRLSRRRDATAESLDPANRRPRQDEHRQDEHGPDDHEGAP